VRMTLFFLLLDILVRLLALKELVGPLRLARVILYALEASLA
jgi:hypothetical protein